jgi:hypothetical protein
MAGVFKGVGDGHITTQTVTEQSKPVDLALDTPFFKSVNEPGLSLSDSVFPFFGLDFEGWPGTTTHAEHVQSMQLPALQSTERLKVLVEKAKAGAIAVKHNQVLVCILSNALDRKLI